MSLEKVEHEYLELEHDTDLIDYSNKCFITKIFYGLPCKNLLRRCIKERKSPLLSLEDFSPRWRHGVNYRVKINVDTLIKTEIIEKNHEIDI